MNEQEKREQVINGLGCKIGLYPNHDCAECDYSWLNGKGQWECIPLSICEDAYNLLKAQMPHILSLYELRELARMDMDNVVWVEYAGENARLNQHVQVDLYFRNPTRVILRVFGEDEGFEPNNEEYGKTWRCWNIKPSKEQMEAMRWWNE